MKRLVFVFLLISCLLFSCSEYEKDDSYSYTITRTEDRIYADKDWVKFLYSTKDDFVILNLTDIQLGNMAYILDFEEISENIAKIINSVKPDLITITGDFSYGCSTAFYGICSFIDSFGIPWAPVFGNHDFEDSDLSPKAQAKVLENFSNCLFSSGPTLAYYTDSDIPARGNYVVNVVDKDLKIIKSLIFMNSGTTGLSCDTKQDEWYKECTLSAESSSSGIFLHMPIHGYRLAAKNAKPLFGVWNESYGPSKEDGFESLMKDNNTDFIVCGHNHGNNACVIYDGINYIYALKTGPGCYYYEGLDGGTKITISKSSSVSVEHVYVTSL